MVPASYVGYFIAAGGAAAALIGLLFVAICLRPSSVLGPTAPASGRALAESSFTCLINAFFISLIAAIPSTKLGIAAVVIALVSLYHTGKLQRRLAGDDSHRLMLAFSAAAFSAELAAGVVLVIRPHMVGCVNGWCYVVAASFAVALARAWNLMRGTHLQNGDVPSGPQAQA
jgi:hypothetical protein